MLFLIFVKFYSIAIVNWSNESIELEWPADQPLPRPKWGVPKPRFVINSIDTYEEIVKNFQYEFQILLKTINYDSVTNFIE